MPPLPSDHDKQILLRDSLWELCSIMTSCCLAAMSAAGAGTVDEIEVALRSARACFKEAVATFKELKGGEG